MVLAFGPFGAKPVEVIPAHLLGNVGQRTALIPVLAEPFVVVPARLKHVFEGATFLRAFPVVHQISAWRHSILDVREVAVLTLGAGVVEEMVAGTHLLLVVGKGTYFSFLAFPVDELLAEPVLGAL